MKVVTTLLIYFLFLGDFSMQDKSNYTIDSGEVHFKSDAPLELIEARSDKLRGIIDFDKGSFAFSLPVSSFEGFNSALQKEHFNENYMETGTYPNATFSGKIIEDVDLSGTGEQEIRAKGILSIHGVEQERILRATIKTDNDKVLIKSKFTVLLRDHNISIPKVVNQKIAEEIYVEINATAVKK